MKEPLDRQVLSDITEGNPELEYELIVTFLQSAPGYIDGIRAAIHDHDSTGVYHNAHSLKGSSAWIGASPTADAALAMELAGRNNEVDRYDVLLYDLESCALRLFGYLEAMISPHC